jgi:hypothetical protein
MTVNELIGASDRSHLNVTLKLRFARTAPQRRAGVLKPQQHSTTINTDASSSPGHHRPFQLGAYTRPIFYSTQALFRRIRWVVSASDQVPKRLRSIRKVGE